MLHPYYIFQKAMQSIGRSPASSMTIKWSPNCISGPFAILEQEDSILEQGETSILAKIFWATRCFFALKFFLQIVIAQVSIKAF